MKKKIDETAVMSELSSSKFFQSPTQAQAAKKAQRPKTIISKPKTKPQTHAGDKGQNDRRKDAPTNITPDVITSLLQDINKREWREMIENTEAHNSSLRLSLTEREKIEDMVRELKRKHKIKTSMNELARLGLLFLTHNFKKHGSKSIIADVKTS